MDTMYPLKDRWPCVVLRQQDWYGLPLSRKGEVIGETDEPPGTGLRYRVALRLDPVPDWWANTFPGSAPVVSVLVEPEYVIPRDSTRCET